MRFLTLIILLAFIKRINPKFVTCCTKVRGGQSRGLSRDSGTQWGLLGGSHHNDVPRNVWARSYDGIMSAVRGRLIRKACVPSHPIASHPQVSHAHIHPHRLFSISLHQKQDMRNPWYCHHVMQWEFYPHLSFSYYIQNKEKKY